MDDSQIKPAKPAELGLLQGNPPEELKDDNPRLGPASGAWGLGLRKDLIDLTMHFLDVFRLVFSIFSEKPS